MITREDNYQRISNGISVAKIFAMLWIFSVNYWVFIFSEYYKVKYSYAIATSKNFIEVMNSNSWISDKIYFVFAYAGWSGVVAFVFLSGFSLWFSVLSSGKFKISEYVIKRFNGIYVSYFLSIVIAFSVSVAVARIEPKAMDFSALIMGAAKLVPHAYAYNPPYWFITLLLLLYLFFPIIPIVYARFNLKGLLSLNLLGLIFFVYIGPEYFLKTQGPFYPILPFFIFLCLGALFCHIMIRYSRIFSNFDRSIKILLYVIIEIGGVYLLYQYLFAYPSLNADLPWYVVGHYYAGTIGATMFFFNGYLLPIKYQKIIRFLSRGTFAVFLYHYLLLPYILPYIKPDIFTSHLSIAFPLLFSIMLICGSVFQYLLDSTIIKYTTKLTSQEYKVNV